MTDRKPTVILASDVDIDVDCVIPEDVVYVDRSATMEEAIDAVGELTDQHQNVKILWGDTVYTVARHITVEVEETDDRTIH